MNRTLSTVGILIGVISIGFASFVFCHSNEAAKNKINLNMPTLTWIEDTADTMGISFEYPSNWYVDKSMIHSGFTSVSSTAVLDLNTIQNTGKIDINAIRTNPKKLTPREWIDATFADERTELQNEEEFLVGAYSAYEFTIEELQMRRHVFLFHNFQVVEIAFPTVQPNYQSIYDHILNSIKITTPTN